MAASMKTPNEQDLPDSPAQQAATHFADIIRAFDVAMAAGRLGVADRLLTNAHRAFVLGELQQRERDTQLRLLRACRWRLDSALSAAGRTVRRRVTGAASTHEEPQAICNRCGRFFTAPPANRRRRLCGRCWEGTSSSVRAVSAGLPTLGKRR